jgi:hypothetical protein
MIQNSTRHRVIETVPSDTWILRLRASLGTLFIAHGALNAFVSTNATSS